VRTTVAPSKPDPSRERPRTRRSPGRSDAARLRRRPCRIRLRGVGHGGRLRNLRPAGGHGQRLSRRGQGRLHAPVRRRDPHQLHRGAVPWKQRPLSAATAAFHGLVLGYNLFVDLARSRLWGDGTGGTSLASGAFTVGPGAKNGIKELRHAIYGRIPALQDAPPGAYADTIVVTLTF